MKFKLDILLVFDLGFFAHRHCQKLSLDFDVDSNYSSLTFSNASLIPDDIFELGIFTIEIRSLSLQI